MVRQGDAVLTRYRVDAVLAQSVLLVDGATGASLRLDLRWFLARSLAAARSRHDIRSRAVRRTLPGGALVKRIGALFGIVAACGWLATTHASSHREAPLISQDPLADNTDVYAFVSPRNPDRVTLISNFIPLEAPYGGPNFFKFDDNVLYEIMVDNDGDAVEDVTFQFRFRTETRNLETFLYNTGVVTSLDDPDLNVRQFYSITRVDGPRRLGRGTRARGQPAGGAGQRRRPLDARLRAACRRRRASAAQQHPSVRRTERRRVLREPRRLRPARRAAGRQQHARLDCRVQRPLDCARSADRVADQQRSAADGRERPRRRRRRLVHGEPAFRHHSRGGRRKALEPPACRCRASAIRSSTRS